MKEDKRASPSSQLTRNCDISFVTDRFLYIEIEFKNASFLEKNNGWMVFLLNHNKNAKCFAFKRKQILTIPCFQIKCNYRTAKTTGQDCTLWLYTTHYSNSHPQTSQITQTSIYGHSTIVRDKYNRISLGFIKKASVPWNNQIPQKGIIIHVSP